MSNVRFWGVVPAAGSGSRMSGAPRPKQYLPLAGRTVIEWSLQALLAHPGCVGVVVVLAAQDDYWPALSISNDVRIITAQGGAQRADSVRAGLAALAGQCTQSDWVLVHDAARPCLRMSDLQRLLDQLHDETAGGLLAAPLVDTLKRADPSQRVAQTISREQLWRAQTPQMFRHGVLSRALASVLDQGITVTDESQAIELAGLQPRLIAGHADNIKITIPEDLLQAERILGLRSGS